MRVIILKDKEEIGKWSAYLIAKRINEFKPTEQRPFVLGLPTGSTPLVTYRELINLYKEGLVSFNFLLISIFLDFPNLNFLLQCLWNICMF